MWDGDGVSDIKHVYVVADMDDFADIKCTTESEEFEESSESSANYALKSAESHTSACAFCEVCESWSESTD